LASKRISGGKIGNYYRLCLGISENLRTSCRECTPQHRPLNFPGGLFLLYSFFLVFRMFQSAKIYSRWRISFFSLGKKLGNTRNLNFGFLDSDFIKKKSENMFNTFGHPTQIQLQNCREPHLEMGQHKQVARGWNPYDNNGGTVAGTKIFKNL
jgi:hypothetical protein